MRLKYSVSRKSGVTSNLLQELIVSRLKEDNYQIINEGNKMVSFNSYGSIINRIRAFSSSKLFEGVFKIIELDNQTSIELTYFLSIKPQILIMLATIIYSFFVDIGGLIIGVFAILAIVLEIYNQKKNAENLLDNIID